MTDVMNSDVVDGIATWLDGMALPLPGVEFENDEAAADSPVRVLMVSAEQYNRSSRAPLPDAASAGHLSGANGQEPSGLPRRRAALANSHPQDAEADPFLSGRYGPVVRFHHLCNRDSQDDSCARRRVRSRSRHSARRPGPSRKGSGRHNGSGSSYFTAEETTDFGNQRGYVVGEIGGRSKIRFLIDHGNEQQYTDYGVAAIDTAVRLAGV